MTMQTTTSRHEGADGRLTDRIRIAAATTTFNDDRTAEDKDFVTRVRVSDSVQYSRRVRHDFFVQAVRSSSDSEDRVYFATFQRGRGQHITTLTREEARELGEFLVGFTGGESSR